MNTAHDLIKSKALDTLLDHSALSDDQISVALSMSIETVQARKARKAKANEKIDEYADELTNYLAKILRNYRKER